MTKTERDQLERLVAQLEDPVQVRDSFVIPKGSTREFSRGYVEGAKMEAKATAASLREMLGMKKEEQ
jgi:hypothetical protein